MHTFFPVRNFFIFILLAIVAGCVPPGTGDNGDQKTVNLSLKDRDFQQVMNLVDKRLTDSLYRYFRHPSANMRYVAAMGIASSGDSLAIDSLAVLLRDPSEEVRVAAAFAIGQCGSTKGEIHLLHAFDRYDSLSVHQLFNATILEAVGKCGTLAQLQNIAAISSYEATDTFLLEGQCKSVYRYALRNITDASATQRMCTYMGNERMPESVKLIAANYLARAKEVVLDSSQASIISTAFWRTTNNNIRMSLAKALGKNQSPIAFNTISKALTTERDYRVKCNLIHALAKMPGDTVFSMVSAQLRDTSLHVAVAAAEFFLRNGNQNDGDRYWRLDKDETLPWQVRTTLYQATNKWAAPYATQTRDYINFRLREWFDRTTNPYEKAACIAGLAEFPWQFRWIQEKGFNDPNPVVKSAATEAFKNICGREDFFRFFGGGSSVVLKEMNIYLLNALQSGDPAMMANASEALMKKDLNFPAYADSMQMTIVHNSLKKLRLPRDIESYRVVQKMVDYYDGKIDRKEERPTYNNPIDWNLLLTLKSEVKALISTSKGDITVELYPVVAPGTVASFMKLANEGFYKGKNFHRVVPNFVIQGGCPRGDGAGGLDFSLRTEIGMMNYSEEGMLGMASAGLDTEGTQFFITHSPALHLDGKYTLFGKVIEGMNVLHSIQINDKIKDITIL